eukprot:Plantae.Rhodophyta-Purpureofilum_apyrenoidigerum.ctg13812.p1 GENE.Plantae.Rhodophyta-Purpureofilum_apyrenoidigerum.ctg13812~~Plantae.Rhodophyta-Purpureofilum_apyrenoidigerum.ctg13812.p1  ORF type:complete len:329 (-),score=64.15 Plantae.Rhodophyta-Purpureofilum_apyrenoidigerum.ctg13812:433-1344(-)
MSAFVASVWRGGRCRLVVRCCSTKTRKGGGGGSNMIPRNDVLNHARHHGLEQEVAARVVDIAERAVREFSVAATPFLRPLESFELEVALGRLADLSVSSSGGYPQAERKRMFFSPEELVDLDCPPEEMARHFLCPIEIRGNFLFDPAKHGDFLGAITGSGIDRDFVGDIIVLGDRGAQAIVSPEIVNGLQTFVKQVRSVPVQVSEIGWDQLYYKDPKKKSIVTVEKSLRLDSVGSAGFGVSRTKLGDEIKSGNVLVNWKEIKNTSATVKEGDIINYRGKGRVTVDAISITSKGKHRIEMSRFT